MAAAVLLACPLGHKAGGASVVALHRYPVKGLGFDALDSVHLAVGATFPDDRSFALLRAGQDEFDPAAPRWLHKGAFAGAFSRGAGLSRLRSSFDHATRTLTVVATDDATSVTVNIDDAAGRRAVAAFVSAHALEGEAVELVSAREPSTWQFGNTASGLRAGTGDVRTLHLLAEETAAAVGRAVGSRGLACARFRPNVVVSGCAAFAEDGWVGRDLRVAGPSGLRLRVISRTVRCAGVDHPPPGDAGDEAGHVPDLAGRLAAALPAQGPFAGVYAQVVAPGVLRVGDRLQVVER